MASSSQSADGLTPAQRMMQQHTAHQPTVEDVPDEADKAQPLPSYETPAPVPDPVPAVANGTTMSEKVAGKQKVQDAPSNKPSTNRSANTPLDMKSEEAFPSLGPSIAKAPAAATWGTRPSSVMKTNGVSTPPTTSSPSVSTPAPGRPTSRGSTQPISLPGRYTEDMQMLSEQLRKDLRKPVSDVLRDINKKSKARVEMIRNQNYVTFKGAGPSQESVQQILKEVAAQLGKKETIKVPIPVANKAHIIGKAGSTIQGISKRSGARVQMPRADSNTQVDDDTMIDIDIEGNPIAVRLARNEIENIIGQRTSNVNLRMKDVPAEFFPFLAGAHNSQITALQDGRDVNIHIPHYDTWRNQAPPEPRVPNKPAEFAPQDGLHIQIAGERDAARYAQEELERQVKELRERLTVNQLPGIERERHQFILGEQGRSLHDFLQETGCSIVFPPTSEDTETIAVVGPPEYIEEATNRVMDLASSMTMTNIDVARQHQSSKQDASSHNRNLAQYMRQRRALQALENQYNAQVVFPAMMESAAPWQLYTRDSKNGMRARNDILNMISGHPPTRFRNVDVHPYYQRELERRHAQQLRDRHGVHVVMPENGDDSQVLLVYEDRTPVEQYNFPQKKPSSDEIAQFQQELQAAEELLLSLIGAQEDIVHRTVEAPLKYREKLQRYVNREQREPQTSYPVEFLDLNAPAPSSSRNFPLEFRGPTSEVDEYAQRLAAFIEEQIRDEAERDYTVTCEFPQKHAHHLIGRRGENINKLRDEFDVEIQVNEGEVTVKGPKAKADSARSHILGLGKKLEDEATFVLKIDPKFHRELIGAKGAQVIRLQDKYGVRVNFPRSSSGEESPIDGASDAGAAKRRQAQAPDEVVIKGPRRHAEEARDDLHALYLYAQELAHTATVSIAQSQLPSLIGQGGRELQNIRDMTGADIDVPNSRDAADSSGRVEVKLKGRKEAVAKAKELLQGRIQAYDATITKTIDVERKYHRDLIGRQGENIRQITVAAGGPTDQREAARTVKFPRPEATENTIRVEGTQDVVDKIIEAIQSFVSLRENQVTETIEVPPERHGGLIGRGGQVRRGIETDHSVTMMIPSADTQGPQRSQVQITGLPADVQQAKDRIASMIKDSEGETIRIPTRLHPTISDNGTFFRVLNRDLKVTVDHQGRNPPRADNTRAPQPKSAAAMPLITDPDEASILTPDDIEDKTTFEILSTAPPAPSDTASDETIPWVLKGPNPDAVAEAKKLIEAAKTAAENSVTGYLVLPDPRTHKSVIGPAGSTVNGIRASTGCKIDVPKAGAGGAVEIKGTREKVEEAKEMILEAVKDAVERNQRY